MALFEIRWKKFAQAELRKLPKSVIQRIIKAVEKLAIHPYPQGGRKIQGAAHAYRIRVSDYRVLYSVESFLLLIEIIKDTGRRSIIIFPDGPFTSSCSSCRVGKCLFAPRSINLSNFADDKRKLSWQTRKNVTDPVVNEKKLLLSTEAEIFSYFLSPLSPSAHSHAPRRNAGSGRSAFGTATYDAERLGGISTRSVGTSRNAVVCVE